MTFAIVMSFFLKFCSWQRVEFKHVRRSVNGMVDSLVKKGVEREISLIAPTIYIFFGDGIYLLFPCFCLVAVLSCHRLWILYFVSHILVIITWYWQRKEQDHSNKFTSPQAVANLDKIHLVVGFNTTFLHLSRKNNCPKTNYLYFSSQIAMVCQATCVARPF